MRGNIPRLNQVGGRQRMVGKIAIEDLWPRPEAGEEKRIAYATRRKIGV